MSQLLSQLGIDWRLLIAQAVNFFLLLVILRLYVYKPLLKMLHDRRQRIEDGVVKAEEADRRLSEAEQLKLHKVKEGEAAAMALMRKTEVDAKETEARMLAEAKRKEAEALQNMQAVLKAREDESRRAFEKDAVALVRRAIARTVELAPEQIDDALIARAIEQAKT